MTKWLSLMEYATQTGISLSTLRRYIKANKVKYRVEDGRYMLWHDDQPSLVSSSDAAPSSSHGSGTSEVHQLQTDLNKAREEIAELKTLIALYEDTPSAAHHIL